MNKKQLAEHDAAAMKVLESWPGTPEELGVALYEATMPPLSRWATSSKARQEERELITTAQNRIRACSGGEELLILERRFMRER